MKTYHISDRASESCMMYKTQPYLYKNDDTVLNSPWATLVLHGLVSINQDSITVLLYCMDCATSQYMSQHRNDMI